MSAPIGVLKCSNSIKINCSIDQVFRAIAESDQLRQYFASGGAVGDLVAGSIVQWGFADYPEAGMFDVKVLKVEEPKLIHLSWTSCVPGEWNDVIIELEAIEPTRTLVRITETGWPATEKGIQGVTENSGGWMNMLDCLKAYLEHGILLRDF